mmetsp:Transcript_5730/g.13905  ORF Transcript_5730/g.13905 Transcript_5730/m.13905 type:complete len:255 (+) Transcript_5730:135-899(+)
MDHRGQCSPTDRERDGAPLAAARGARPPEVQHELPRLVLLEGRVQAAPEEARQPPDAPPAGGPHLLQASPQPGAVRGREPCQEPPGGLRGCAAPAVAAADVPELPPPHPQDTRRGFRAWLSGDGGGPAAGEGPHAGAEPEAQLPDEQGQRGAGGRACLHGRAPGHGGARVPRALPRHHCAQAEGPLEAQLCWPLSRQPGDPCGTDRPAAGSVPFLPMALHVDQRAAPRLPVLRQHALRLGPAHAQDLLQRPCAP